MCSDAGDWTCLQPGFPIRKSSDHSLVIDSPRLIADSYVLHRFLVPRHPPCALKNLATKMLASTIQFSNNTRTPTTNTPSAPASWSRPRENPHPANPHTTHSDAEPCIRQVLFPQDPTTCRHPHALHNPVTSPPHHHPHPTPKRGYAGSVVVLAGPDQTEAPRGTMIDVPPMSTPPAHTRH